MAKKVGQRRKPGSKNSKFGSVQSVAHHTQEKVMIVSESIEHPWGRVDSEGNVYLREEGAERLIGQFLGGSPSDAVEFYERKYQDLEAQVLLLEQRAKAGADSKSLISSLAKLKEALSDAAVLGDLAALKTRLEALDTSLEALKAQQQEENAELMQQALAEREELLQRLEKLAASPKESISWKSIDGELDRFMTEWKQQQARQPRLPRKTADELWQRFRTASNSLKASKKAFFSNLEQTSKAARSQKAELIERAKAIQPDDPKATSQYNALLDEWKKTGRSGRKYDDQLWADFKAAGDAIFQQRVQQDEQQRGENQAAKEQLIADYAYILNMTDLGEARRAWIAFLGQWEQFGRVPKSAADSLNSSFKKMEKHLHDLESAHWGSADPEAEERVSQLTEQLHRVISELEEKLAVAQQAGNASEVAELQDSIAEKQSWLLALES